MIYRRMVTVKMILSDGTVIIVGRVFRYNARKPGVKEQITVLTLNSSGVRDIARNLGINRNTVVSELKKRPT